MKTQWFVLVGVLMMAGCGNQNPRNITAVPPSVVVTSADGDKASLQIVTVDGYRFAVLQNMNGQGVSICQVLTEERVEK